MARSCVLDCSSYKLSIRHLHARYLAVMVCSNDFVHVYLPADDERQTSPIYGVYLLKLERKERRVPTPGMR